jgi:hypothetical protein
MRMEGKIPSSYSPPISHIRRGHLVRAAIAPAAGAACLMDLAPCLTRCADEAARCNGCSAWMRVEVARRAASRGVKLHWLLLR